MQTLIKKTLCSALYISKCSALYISNEHPPSCQISDNVQISKYAAHTTNLRTGGGFVHPDCIQANIINLKIIKDPKDHWLDFISWLNAEMPSSLSMTRLFAGWTRSRITFLLEILSPSFSPGFLRAGDCREGVTAPTPCRPPLPHRVLRYRWVVCQGRLSWISGLVQVNL